MNKKNVTKPISYVKKKQKKQIGKVIPLMYKNTRKKHLKLRECFTFLFKVKRKRVSKLNKKSKRIIKIM